MRVSCEIGRQNYEKISDKKFDKNKKFDQTEKFDQKEKFNQIEKFDKKIDHNDLTENEGGPHQSFNLTMSKALMEVFT